MGAGISDPISVFYYIALPPQCSASLSKESDSGIDEVVLTGECPGSGVFTFIVNDGSINKKPQYNKEMQKLNNLPDLSRTHYLGFRIEEADSLWQVEEAVKQSLQHTYAPLFQQFMKVREEIEKSGMHPLLIPTLQNQLEKNSNVFVFQKIFQPPFDLDVLFVAHAATSTRQLSGPRLMKMINSFLGSKLTNFIDGKKKDFDKTFDEVFQSASWQPKQTEVAKAAFSNLIGGMGYFHGSSYIKNGENVLASPPGSLFTAVPSRPFFPRGFLWDEGFHQLILSEWDWRISLESLLDWTNLMLPNGWIPREQILGSEAVSRVPTEFVFQNPDHANPPSLFLLIDKLVTLATSSSSTATQASTVIRDDESQAAVDGELLSHDKPVKEHHQQQQQQQQQKRKRGSFPEPLSSTVGEATLRRFFVEGEVFEKISRWYNWLKSTQTSTVPFTFQWKGRTENHTFTSGLDDYPRARFPSDSEAHLDLQCWMIICARTLAKVAQFIGADSYPFESDMQEISRRLELFWDVERELYSDISSLNIYASSETVFSPHIGYVSLFPLISRSISSNSPRLGKLLEVLSDKKKLWSKFGLRSLAADDPLFGAGENYWRGPIWININYLVLSALHSHYAKEEGPYRERAQKLYSSLRTNLINNMVREYHDSGFIWEQYVPSSGKGKGTRPFTGWSALIVNILAERYV